MEIFEKDQVLFVKSENLRNNPQAEIDRVCNFLGVKKIKLKDNIIDGAVKYRRKITEEEKSYLLNIYENEIRSSKIIKLGLLRLAKMKILCTVGPSTLNKNFLKLSSELGISLLRLNLSHIKIENLKKQITFIRKYTDVAICLDSEGAQIRTRDLKFGKKLKKNQIVKIYKENDVKKSLITFYPDI